MRASRNAVAFACALGLAAFAPAAVAAKGDASDARERVQDATKTVRDMESDPNLKQLMSRAKGILVVPNYARAAVGVGGQGGTGVLLVNRNGRWDGPGFYNVGGVSVGAQAGVEVGEIAFLLMNQKALNAFRQDNRFSLNAGLGFTIVNYSADAKAMSGRGDVIVWSGTKGVFGNASVGVSDINFDEDETRAYAGRNVTRAQVVDGSVSAPEAQPLLAELNGLGRQGSTAGTADRAGRNDVSRNEGASTVDTNAATTSATNTMDRTNTTRSTNAGTRRSGRLPHTASSFPVLALIGLGALVGAAAWRMLSR